MSKKPSGESAVTCTPHIPRPKGEEGERESMGMGSGGLIRIVWTVPTISSS